MTESEVYLKRKIHELESKIMQDSTSNAIFELSNLYKDNNDIRKALEYCIFGLKKIPNSYQGFLLLGELFFELKNYSKAEKAFANAFKISPSEAEPLFQISNIYMETDNLKKLTAVYHKLEILAPYDKRMPIINDVIHQLRKEVTSKAMSTKKKAVTPFQKPNEQISEDLKDTSKNDKDFNSFTGNATHQKTVKIASKLIVDEHVPTHSDSIEKTKEVENLNLIVKPLISFEALVKKIFEIKGIVGMVYMNSRGEISRSMECDIDLAKSLALILKSYAKAFDVGFKVLDFGHWTESIIILEEGFVFLLDVRDYKLVFNCSNEIQLGNLRARIKSILTESGFIKF